MGSPENKNHLTVNIFHVDHATAAERGGRTTAGTHTVVAHHGNGAATRGGARAPAALRTWKIATERLGLCKVTDYGTRAEVERESDGAVVWRGRATSTSFATTSAPELPAAELREVVHLMLCGEQATFGGHTGPADRATERASKAAASTSPRVATVPPKPRRGRRASAKGEARQPAKRQGAHARRAASKAPGDPQPAGTAKPTPTRRRTPKVVAHTGAPTPHPTPVPTPKPAPKRGRTPKPAAVPATPGGHANQAAAGKPAVDDAAVLTEMKEKLKRDDPERAEELFESCQRIWLAGGREATLAWMAAHNIQGVVDAFEDWMDKNGPAARAILEKASKRPKKGAK